MGQFLVAFVSFHEAKVLLSVPEVSAACAATLVAELGTPADFQHPRQMLKLAGMNLTGRQSGQREGRRHLSKRGPPDAPPPALPPRRPVVSAPWTLSTRVGGDAGAGILGTKAVCSLARRLVPLLLRLMQTGERFDERRWRDHRHHVAA